MVRDFGGQKYVVKYHGKMEGDTISGTIEAPGHDGGEADEARLEREADDEGNVGAAKLKG